VKAIETTRLKESQERDKKMQVYILMCEKTSTVRAYNSLNNKHVVDVYSSEDARDNAMIEYNKNVHLYNTPLETVEFYGYEMKLIEDKS
tara:strand:- start:180 stop:446 length:267 start_codon:yes stop_codon:yes gene_type:complete